MPKDTQKKIIEVPRQWLERLVKRAVNCNGIEVKIEDLGKLTGLLGYIESAQNLLK